LLQDKASKTGTYIVLFKTQQVRAVPAGERLVSGLGAEIFEYRYQEKRQKKRHALSPIQQEQTDTGAGP
jgi:hypothetical protein